MMPSPKSNTVTEDIGNAVEKLKKGQVEFRTDQYGIVHVPIGKSSFSSEELKENLVDLVSSVLDQRPEDGIQGRYLQALTVSSTMGPGIKVEIDQVRKEASGRNL
jgi:large subunit ribosomal protein L1